MDPGVYKRFVRSTSLSRIRRKRVCRTWRGVLGTGISVSLLVIATLGMQKSWVSRIGSLGPFGDENPYHRRTNEETPGIKRSKNRLYVAVMTTGKFLHTRAEAVFNTWGSNPFVSKIDFFARKLSNDNKKYNFSIVTLSGVDDFAYPPQKKSFRMLQYICNTQINQFDWFLRADDDLYVKVQEFIGHVVLPSDSKIGYLGHPGHGRETDTETRRLLGSNTFCMGGPGILFSRHVLQKLCPHLESCLHHVVLRNEDVEVGRCVQRIIGAGCRTPRQMMYRFFHVANDKLPRLLTGNYSDFKPFKRALTLHPLKNPDDMYRIHHYYMALRREQWRSKLSTPKTPDLKTRKPDTTKRSKAAMFHTNDFENKRTVKLKH